VSVRGAALIVLAWNQWPTTRRCLDSMLATDLDAAQVIVVDNGSSDETPLALAAYADRVRIVTLPANLGFVRGMNAGIDAARADDDVVLLNNDLVFEQADWLGRLRDAAYAAPENGVVGCRQLGEGRRLYHAGGFIEADELWGQQTEAGELERDVAQFTRTRRVQGVAFALAYLRRDCIDRIGVLDTIFHSYFEDTDYCLRAADAGVATIVAGAVTLQHEQHGSTRDDGGFRARLWQASRAAFADRWQDRLRAGYRGDVAWQGTTRWPYAHAHLARSFVRRLDARGLRMAHVPLAPEVPSPEDFRLALAGRRRWAPPAQAAVVCGDGTAFARARGRVRVGLGFGEWAQVPAGWRDAARSLDLLLVPDAFQREAFRAAGADLPIEILPIGVDADYCHPRVPAPRDPARRLAFFAVVDALARDAPDGLVRAFRAAFDRDEAVALLVLVRPGGESPAVTETLARAGGGDPRIRVIADWAHPWYQRAQWLAGTDVYVSVRRGGGWDPYAAEALACGKVLVAADFGSQAELARAYGVAVACARSTDPASGLPWAEPDHDAFVAALREVHARREERLARARHDADAFARVHDIEASADQLAARIGELAGLRAPLPAPRPHRPADLPRPPSGQIIVLGMHRSGTSSVAGLLARMGVAVGPEQDLLLGPDNPKGHYESARLHMACVRRLAAAGGDWRDPPGVATPGAVDAFRREVGALVDEFDAQRPWLFKEPRLCLLARELLPLLTRPLFVHVVRDPFAVADSLAARDGFTPQAALALWERYTRDAFEASRGWPRLVVDYDVLCAEPEAETRRLFDALRAAGVDGIHLPPADVVQAWIEPNAQRVRAAAALPTAAQRALQAAIADRSILADAPPASLVAVPRSA
jgi:GT2 family glycosyltransferase